MPRVGPHRGTAPAIRGATNRRFAVVDALDVEGEDDDLFGPSPRAVKKGLHTAR